MRWGLFHFRGIGGGGFSGGLLLPGAPRTPFQPKRLKQMPRYHWHLSSWPDNGGAMPGENPIFTTRVDPVSPPFEILVGT